MLPARITCDGFRRTRRLTMALWHTPWCNRPMPDVLAPTESTVPVVEHFDVRLPGRRGASTGPAPGMRSIDGSGIRRVSRPTTSSIFCACSVWKKAPSSTALQDQGSPARRPGQPVLASTASRRTR